LDRIKSQTADSVPKANVQSSIQLQESIWKNYFCWT